MSRYHRSPTRPRELHGIARSAATSSILHPALEKFVFTKSTFKHYSMYVFGLPHSLSPYPHKHVPFPFPFPFPLAPQQRASTSTMVYMHSAAAPPHSAVHNTHHIPYSHLDFHIAAVDQTGDYSAGSRSRILNYIPQVELGLS